MGWSAINVATTVLISDVTPADQRSRMLGANDVTIGLAELSLPASGGLATSSFGLGAFLLRFSVALPALSIALPLHEHRTGNTAPR